VVRFDANGEVLLDPRKAGIMIENDIVRWGDPLPPHSLETVGTTELRVISVEVKTRAGGSGPTLSHTPAPPPLWSTWKH
jgi:hypothetical protein